MRITPEQIEELNILALYDLSSIQEGIKVHHKTANPDHVAATQRLYDKGLITQNDGGYLTPLGVTTAEHALAVLTVLGVD
jgi:uncharacterized protein (TIGR02647 family)